MSDTWLRVINPPPEQHTGNWIAKYIHLEDGKQEFDHDATPGETHTGDEWAKLRPDMFKEHLDGAVGPNSIYHSRRDKVDKTKLFQAVVTVQVEGKDFTTSELASVLEKCVTVDLLIEDGEHAFGDDGENEVQGVCLDWETLRLAGKPVHLLLKDIKWDSDGMRPVEDCLLPLNVLALNAPANWDTKEYREALADEISKVYGFLHYGFEIVPHTPDSKGKRNNPPFLAVMEAPELPE